MHSKKLKTVEFKNISVAGVSHARAAKNLKTSCHLRTPGLNALPLADWFWKLRDVFRLVYDSLPLCENSREPLFTRIPRVYTAARRFSQKACRI